MGYPETISDGLCYSAGSGISINHAQLDDQHIYFGTVSQVYGNPEAAQTLTFTGENGDLQEIRLNGHSGYLAILPAPLTDFEITDSRGNVSLDLNAFREQGDMIREQSMRISAIVTDGSIGFVREEDLQGEQPALQKFLLFSAASKLDAHLEGRCPR